MRKTSLLLMLCLTVLFVCVAATTYKDTVISIDTTNGIWPNTDNTYDLGKTSYEFKDLYIDGTAYLDAAVIDSITGPLAYSTVTASTVATTATVTVAQSGTTFDNADVKSTTCLFQLPTPTTGVYFTFIDCVPAAGADVWISAPTEVRINGGTLNKYYKCITDAVKQTTTLYATSATAYVIWAEVGTWANDNTTYP